MNWKNVLRLVSVDIKSSRLIRGNRFRRFRENRIVTYALYVVACVFGLLIGGLFGIFYNGISDPTSRQVYLQSATNLFTTLPTLALLYSLVFTQISRFQRIGVKVSVQPPYWFPITWEEHTLASILANLIGTPLIITFFLSSGIAVASVFLGLLPLAIFSIFALLLSVFLASATTEISKVFQTRLLGVVTKVTGRAAIWMRFVGSILILAVFYVLYFSFYYGFRTLALLETVKSAQRIVWFIPYVWPGMVLSSFANGQGLETAVFFLSSLVFLYALFWVALQLNTRFGLYEAPAIRASRGQYVPKVSMLGMLGFSPLEAALMKKDFRALTRRRELLYIFIFPIMLIIGGLISFSASKVQMGQGPMPLWFRAFMFFGLAMLPGSILASALGQIIVGMEGESVWYIYSSPITARSLVRAKYAFVMFFSMAAMSVCFVVGVLFAPPLPEVVTISLIEAVLLIISLSMVSLSFGVKGADFRELPRPRMIRPIWSFINLIVCGILALTIISPVIPYLLKTLFQVIQAPIAISISLPESYLYIALPLSGIVASATTYVFHRIAVKKAEEFLLRAEA